jgi:hypothetical protein
MLPHPVVGPRPQRAKILDMIDDVVIDRDEPAARRLDQARVPFEPGT